MAENFYSLKILIFCHIIVMYNISCNSFDVSIRCPVLMLLLGVFSFRFFSEGAGMDFLKIFIRRYFNGNHKSGERKFKVHYMVSKYKLSKISLHDFLCSKISIQ